MEYPVEGVLNVVRTHHDPAEGWRDIVELCRGTGTEAPWDDLPTPEIERDIQGATEWMRGVLGSEPGPAGVYLGLDTLNMARGAGTNVEIGFAAGDAAAFASPEWVFDLTLRYGEQHLIRGLYDLHRAYSKRRWRRAFDLCDYVFFLGYSGLIFSQVFVRRQERGSLYPTWGFHDGDLLLLGRYADGEFARICSC